MMKNSNDKEEKIKTINSKTRLEKGFVDINVRTTNVSFKS